MRSLLFRFNNRHTVPAAASVIVGLGIGAASAVLSSLGRKAAVETRVLVWVGVGLVAIGLAFGLWGFLRTPIPDTVRLYNILPLLDKYMKRVWTLACEEANRPVDWKRYSEVSDKFNNSVLQVKIRKSGVAERARRQVAEAQDELKETNPEPKSIPEIVRGLQGPSAFLDSSGFGLKSLRDNDATLHRLKVKLGEYQVLPAEADLNSFVQCLMEYAEYSANMFLVWRRGLQAANLPDQTAGDSLQTRYRAELELTETKMKEAGYTIMADISKRIRRLQNAGTDSVSARRGNPVEDSRWVQRVR
jgi:hypothetical protein